MSDGEGDPRGRTAADAPKKSAGKTPRAATPRSTPGQMTRQGIVTYLRKVAADVLWANMDDMEDWELMMADDAATLLDLMADAIEQEADLDPDFPRLVLSDPEPRKAV